MNRSQAFALPWTPLSPLGIYLNDHLAGATGGTELIRRLAGSHGGAWGERLGALAEEIAEDRSTMIDIMRRLDIPIRTYKVAGGWLAEKAGRVKMNGRLAVRSPLSSVIELEMMMLGVEGKASTWRVLRRLAANDERLNTDELDRLLSRSESQVAELEQMRAEAAVKVFDKGEHPPQ